MAQNARPLRADAERNRQRLIEAAAELFRAKGVHVGLDEIARHAGVGVGTAYRRFPDKEELVDALFDDRIAALAALAEEGLALEDPWEGFVHFMTGAAELHATDRSMKEILVGARDQRARVARARARVAPLVSQLVARAQASGDLRKDVTGIDMPLVQYLLAGLTDLEGPGQAGLWRRYLALMLDGLRAPAAGRLPGRALTGEEFDGTFGSAYRSR